MKLYMHPVSMTTRPIRLYIADHGISIDETIIDVMTGEHMQPAWLAMNPNGLVPMLEDGDFRLTESGAILRYLSAACNVGDMPTDARGIARVDEIMSWLAFNFYKDYAYGFVYPQVFDHHYRGDDSFHGKTIAWHAGLVRKWLDVMENHFLARGDWLAGDQKTPADYYGLGLITPGELVKVDFSNWPRIANWLGRMKSSPHYEGVNEAFEGFRGYVADRDFASL